MLQFNLDQMKVLSSSIRSEVFWAFHPYDQKSVNDVAKELGKSAQTVHYHVNALVEIELLVPADTRQRRSRTEQLYLAKGRSALAPGTGVSETYNRYRVRGFKLEAQRMIDGNSHFWGLAEKDPEIIKFGVFRKFNLCLSAEKADKLRSEILNLLGSAVNDQTPEEDGGIQINTIVYMRPSVSQLKKWATSIGVTWEELSRDRIVAENDGELD